ncbi:hypothetical protein Drorol1_Dr00011939 [Drosera rotundifolia]
MDELYCSMEQLKDHFFVIYLPSICNNYNEVILSGTRWFCKTCKNYQLCEGCHQRDTHTLDHGQGHKLFKDSSEEVPVDTEDNDVILDKSIMEIRDVFLSLCQENFYQFDTLCRAKHSSTMILYHLHKKNSPVTNVDDLTYHTLPVNERPATVNAAKEMGSSDILLHAFKCRPTDQSTNPDCHILKFLLLHTMECKAHLSGGCRYCRRMLMSLAKHAKNCKDTNCAIPKCKDMKNCNRVASHGIAKVNSHDAKLRAKIASLPSGCTEVG